MISFEVTEASTSSSSSSSSSSSPSYLFNYDIFLSFRGIDIRKTFADHLYAALDQSGFRTFRDNEELERMEDIKSKLQKAISESRISIIVFSKNYASSSWCLDELLMILQQKKAHGHVVLPVFYHVEPSDIRWQRGRFGEAFERLQEKLKDRNEDLFKLDQWKAALWDVSNLSGMDIEETNGYEAEFIQKIVQEVEKKLRGQLLPTDFPFIAIGSQARSINHWLETADTHVMILCGIPGAGKTLLAKHVYNSNFSKFQYSSFIQNVNTTLNQAGGLQKLQEQLFADILKKREREVYNTDEAIVKFPRPIFNKKGLLILDDVDEIEQLDKLGMRRGIPRDCKIIITTRNQNLLSGVQEDHEVQRIKLLSQDESLKLFSHHAFGLSRPRNGFGYVSRIAVNYCGGHPLALKELACSLSREDSLNKWTSKLNKLIEVPNDKIFRVLKGSYDSLDDHDKMLFLLIACLFIGNKKTDAITILNACDFHAEVGIDNLVERCMLTVTFNLSMHQLIQDMAKFIVLQESNNEPGESCILWNDEDSFNVLKEKTGTNKIKSLALDMSRLNERGVLETDDFTNMHNLKLLKLSHVHLQGSYANFPRRLRYVCWDGFPLPSIPNDFPMQRLVILEMRYSSLKYVWNGFKELNFLEILNLSNSQNLRKTPNVSKVPRLGRLILENCTALTELDESTGHLKKLVWLNLQNCKNLSTLPESMGGLESLEILIVSGSKLKELPRGLGVLRSLRILHADGIGKHTANSFMWKWISRRQQSPQISWAHLSGSLVSLSLSNCNLSECDFPTELRILSSLKRLYLDNNPISRIPGVILYLARRLDILSLNSCKKLLSINIELQSTCRLLVRYCTSLERVTWSYHTPKIKLVTSNGGCGNLVELQKRFKMEPIQNVDTEIIKNLGLSQSGSLQTSSAMLSMFCTKGKILPLQVCFFSMQTKSLKPTGIRAWTRHRNWNVFSTCIPRSKRPFWLGGNNGRCHYCLVNFQVPSYVTNIIIHGLAVRVVYHQLFDRPPPFPFLQRWLIMSIENKTKNTIGKFCNDVVGLPGSDEEMQWFTYFNFENLLEAGDELKIETQFQNFFSMLKRNVVKEVGVRLLYKEHEQGATLSTIEEIHTLGEYIPRNVAAYLASTPNLSSELKLTSNGISRGNRGPAGFGGVITNEKGMWVVGCYGNLGVHNSLEATLLGIKRTITFVKNQGLLVGIEIEIDSNDAYQLLSGKVSETISSTAKQTISSISRSIKGNEDAIQCKLRERNPAAVRLAEMGADQGKDFVILPEPPLEFKHMLLTDMGEISSDV